MSAVKKIESKYKPSWRKAHMIDLNTLDTPEKWLKKLDPLIPAARTAMIIALRRLRYVYDTNTTPPTAVK